jgi:hypothetical protein
MQGRRGRLIYMPMNPETLKAMKARLAKMDRTMSLMKRSDDNVHADAYVQDVTYLRKCVSALIAECNAFAAEVERQAAEIAELRDIVDALADTGKCHYDHHGYCQEHLWFKSDVECPHARAQRLWDADGNELPILTDLAHE